MNLTIISILRMVVAAALARAAPTGAVASVAARLCKDGEPDCSTHPFDPMAIQAMRRTVIR